jgi:putative membrane protein insertion efficiency factor
MMNKYRKSELLYRPKIDWKRCVVYVSCAVIVSAIMSCLTDWIMHKNLNYEVINQKLQFIKYIFFTPGDTLFAKLLVIYLFIISIVFLKRILIFMVIIYQCYAPDSMRLSCRFNPSCSQYMIMAIQKYGAIKGLIKGIKRISRCHVPNGGDDFP